MALGTLTSKDASAANGPVFYDRITMPGDSSYTTNGSASFQAALRALRGDSRTIISLRGYSSSAVGYTMQYVQPVFDTDGVTVLTADKLKVLKETETGSDGTSAEVANATDLSSITFTLEVVSK